MRPAEAVPARGARAVTVLVLLFLVGGVGAQTRTALALLGCEFARENVHQSQVGQTPDPTQQSHRGEASPALGRLTTRVIRVLTVSNGFLPAPRAPDAA